MIRGTVKWYSALKGYGFITHSLDGNHKDYFFHISSVIGPEAPEPGDLVDFLERQGKKGKEAFQVKIAEKKRKVISTPHHYQETNAQQPRNDKIRCWSCGRDIVPRIQFLNGNAVDSLCPFCRASQDSPKGCFVATAAFDNEQHPTVSTLREFRDSILAHSSTGRAVVNLYYNYSPRLAKWVEHHPATKPAIRRSLTSLARLLRRLT